MVIDHPDRLHVGVAGGRAHEFKAAFFQVFCQRIRLRGACGVVAQLLKCVVDGLMMDKTPYIRIKRTEFSLNL